MQGAGCAPSLADLDLIFHLDHGPCGSVPIAPARIKAAAAICSFDFAAEVSADAICSCRCWCSVPAERQNSAGAPSAYVIELSASRHRGGWPTCGQRVGLTVFFACAPELEARAWWVVQHSLGRHGHGAASIHAMRHGAARMCAARGPLQGVRAAPQ